MGLKDFHVDQLINIGKQEKIGWIISVLYVLAQHSKPRYLAANISVTTHFFLLSSYLAPTHAYLYTWDSRKKFDQLRYTMAFKITWKTLLPTCFQFKSLTLDSKSRVSKQNSDKRLSLSDISDSGSLLSASDLSNSLVGSNLHIFTLTELKLITNDFSSSNFLGEGGFGPVHKGFIDDKFGPGLRAQPVAVKLLDLDGTQGHREWLVIIQLEIPHAAFVKFFHFFLHFPP